MLEAAQKTRPAWRVQTDDDVEHALIVIDNAEMIQKIQQAFVAIPSLYIADGHHRSAAASRVATQRAESGSSGWFLAGLFPNSEVRILAYNRVVTDLAGLSPDDFLTAVAETFHVEVDGPPRPESRGTCSMYLGGCWYKA